MSVIAGIDFSTYAIDIALLNEDDNDADWHRFTLPAKAGDAFERTRHVRATMPSCSWWEDHGVIATGIEQPRGNHGITPLFRIQGAILQCLPAGLLVQPWNPADWRKACGLKGNAPKDHVTDRAIDLWHNASQVAYCDGETQDTFDAFCIAYATRERLERPVELADTG